MAVLQLLSKQKLHPKTSHYEQYRINGLVQDCGNSSPEGTGVTAVLC